jgi:D-glycero-D-manno-heptose 1,7-bisphosphate phosphatase
MNLRSAKKMKHIFLDRDGTLIRHIPYLCDPAQVQLLPTVVAGLKRLLEARCQIFLHTNQSGIGRSYFSLADAVACNDEMLDQIGLGRELFKGICICPEAPDQAISYRKPSPAYGLEMIEKYGIDKGAICYIGDNVTDLLTASNIGCAGVGVNTGLHDLRTMLREHGLEGSVPVFECFIDAVNHVLQEPGAHEAD